MNIIIGLIVIIFGILALFLFCAFAAVYILVEFVSENILPLSAMAAAYLLVRYFGL